MMQIRLRDVTSDDLEMLREHRNQLGTRCWLGDDREISEADQRRWFESGGAQGVRIVMLGHPVGIVRVSVSGEVGCDVFEPYRGKGYGRRLFSAACGTTLALMGERSSYKLWLKVVLQNAPALRIYTKAGFVIPPGYPVEVLSSRRIPGRDQPVDLHYVYMEQEFYR